MKVADMVLAGSESLPACARPLKTKVADWGGVIADCSVRYLQGSCTPGSCGYSNHMGRRSPWHGCDRAGRLRRAARCCSSYIIACYILTRAAQQHLGIDSGRCSALSQSTAWPAEQSGPGPSGQRPVMPELPHLGVITKPGSLDALPGHRWRSGPRGLAGYRIAG